MYVYQISTEYLDFLDCDLQHCGLAADVMVVAIETYQNEGKPLEPPEQTLKSEGFYNRKHTVGLFFFNEVVNDVCLCSVGICVL